jgi:hypothetical protein
MLMRTTVAAFVMMLCIATAFAEDQLGVAVYPGAQYDQAASKKLRDSLSVKGAAYLTSDDIAKVTAFYRKQGLLYLKIGSSSNEVARFKKVDTDVEVVVQNRRKDATMTGTLILIYKKEGKGSKPDLLI